MPLEASCTNIQKVIYTAAPTRSDGSPAPLDGALRGTVISGDGTVFQDPATPLQIELLSGTAEGDTVFLVEADADPSVGEVLIGETVTLHVSQAFASSLGGSLSAPVPK